MNAVKVRLGLPSASFGVVRATESNAVPRPVHSSAVHGSGKVRSSN